MVDTSRAQKIDGWMCVEELDWLATQAQSHNRILEVGSWMGRSTRALADHTSGIVYAVDTWRGSKEVSHEEILKDKSGDWLFNEFLSNMKGREDHVVPFRMRSLDAADMFRGSQFDMIFLDASHDYENIRADILAWRPMLIPGGLLCGHDYSSDEGWIGVKQAVDELVPKHSCVANIWYEVE